MDCRALQRQLQQPRQPGPRSAPQRRQPLLSPPAAPRAPPHACSPPAPLLLLPRGRWPCARSGPRRGAAAVAAAGPASSSSSSGGSAPAPAGAGAGGQIGRILSGVGARRVLLPSQQAAAARAHADQAFSVESVEVFALLMNALQNAQVVLPPLLWKRSRRALARALLGDVSAAAARAELEALAAARLPPGGVAEAASTALAWVAATRAKRSWSTLQPLLRRVLDTDPKPAPQVHRDGHAAEAWAVGRLQLSAAGVGWQVHGSAARADVALEKGVKGEADALLLDPSGTCQGVVEVKVGSQGPYRALYNDVRKLRRMIAALEGGVATFELLPEGQEAAASSSSSSDSSSSSSSASSSSSGGGGGRGDARGQASGLGPQVCVRFARSVVPVYLVVMDGGGASMEGEAALAEAEASVMKVLLSRAMGSPQPWLRGEAELLEVDSGRALVRVRGSLVASMRRRIAHDFYDTLGSCELYQVERPAGATW